jgi:hypothetical protein
MGLIANVFIIAVIVVAVLFAIGYYLGGSKQQLDSAQAVAEVTKFINDSFPNSVVNITTNVTPSSSYPGSWYVQAQAVINGTKPCPSDFVYTFDVPAFSLVNNTQNVLTAGCKVYETAIGAAPVAIAWTYSKLNISQTHSFVDAYSYKNVTVSANHFQSTVLNGINFTDVWLVTYSAPLANHTVSVVLNQSSGTAVYVFNTST